MPGTARAQASEQDRLAMQRYVSAVRKYECGEPLTEAEQRMIAYGHTAAMCGQRFVPGDDKYKRF